MKGDSQRYKFETIDQLGVHIPNYHRMDRTLQKVQDVQPLQNSKNLDHLNTAHKFQVHRAYDNGFINSQVPDLALTNKKQLLSNRTISPYSIGSPFREYTQRLQPPVNHISPIYSGNLYQNENIPPPTVVRNMNGQTMHYYNKGDSLPPPPMENFHQPAFTQLVNTQPFINPHNIHYEENVPQYVGVDDSPALMDVYSELPRDQCYYCVQNIGLDFQGSEKYYNADWIQERENHNQLIQQQIQSQQEKKSSTKYKQWEREIEDLSKKKKSKKLDEVMENISMESDITKRPEDYFFDLDNLGKLDKTIFETIDNDRKQSQINFKKNADAALVVQKLKHQVQKKKQQKELEQINRELDEQDENFLNVEDLIFTDLDHLSDDEKRRLLRQYELMRQMNDELKNDQIRSEKSLNRIYQFVENEINNIQDEVITKGLDNLTKRLQNDEY